MRPQKHETHSKEFREEAIRQVRESREPLTKLARDLGVNYGTLRAENRQLRLEREILKQATAFFAKHSK